MQGTFDAADQGGTFRVTLYVPNFAHPVNILIEGNTAYVSRTTAGGALLVSGFRADQSGESAVDALRAGLLRHV